MLHDKRWCGVAVQTAVWWPTTVTKVIFESRELILRPADADHRPSLELEFDSSLSWGDAHSLLRRYLSALSWAEGFPIVEVFFLSGGTRVGFGNRPLAHHSTHYFQHNNISGIAPDPRAVLAAALYREALGVNSLPYQILGFFKIINVVYDKSGTQRTWIASAIPHLKGPDVSKRLADLQSRHPDVAKYLYESCRCAVAHAYAAPVVDPDLTTDDERLRLDLPVIRALAERLMTVELAMKR